MADYLPSVDFLTFSLALYANAADVLDHSQQMGNDVVITHDASNVITLQNVSLAELTQHTSHFLFV